MSGHYDEQRFFQLIERRGTKLCDCPWCGREVWSEEPRVMLDKWWYHRDCFNAFERRGFEMEVRA